MDFETYSRSKQFDYAALAEAVESILRTAIAAHPDALRLQQVQRRAKKPESLKKKLEDRNLLSTTTLETDIKDLAGCRLIFYTNSDVSRFLNSGIIQDNFEVDWTRTKIHHPVPGKTEPDNLFISNNYVLKLKADRTALPEYARFSDIWCEVQVQTTLNHAWSEMEHDIIYKKPTLEGFGGKLFEAIQQRLQTIMKTHLLPAGYEFQKVLNDYERLMSGKAILDRGALKALADCEDNNARHELLERFRDYVLPNYDDPQSVYPEVKEQIVAAVKEARKAKPRPIETPIGSYPGISVDRVVGVAADIFVHLRYVVIETTLDAVCELFPGAQSDAERKHLLQIAERLAQHNLDAWKQVGPLVQTILVQKIRTLAASDVALLRPLILEVLGELLGTEVRGTSSTYNSVTLHSGPIIPSDALTRLRTEALDILMTLYRNAPSEDERRRTVNTIFEATHTPSSANYSKDLLVRILNDSAAVAEFCREIAASDRYEMIQTVEDKLLWQHRRNQGIRNDPKSDAQTLEAADGLRESIIAFRNVVDANRQFTIYKTLVGFESVFPPAWDNESFDYSEEEAYRKERIDELVAEVNADNADEWFAIIQRCAQTESNDLGTFPSFGMFLEKLSRGKPQIVLGFIDKLNERLRGFLGIMLSGLAQSDSRADMEERISQWLTDDKHLVQIAHYFRFAPTLDSAVLQEVLAAGIRKNDDGTVAQVLATVAFRYKDGTPSLIDSIIMPAIDYFTKKGDARWVNVVWFLSKDRSFLPDLNAAQVDIALKSLLHLPEVESHAERVLVLLAATFPEEVFDFFGDRLAFSASRNERGRYQAIPYQFHGLEKSVANIADHAIDTARRWFGNSDRLFQFTGGRLLSISFPNFPDALKDKFSSLIRSGSQDDVAFVVRVLSSYTGQPFLYETCREIVRALPTDDRLLGDVQMILQSTGVVSGEFGLVEAYQQKREAIAAWLSDDDSKVRSFAEKYVGSLDLQIAAEQRRSEEDIEMRKRMYDDPSGGDGRT